MHGHGRADGSAPLASGERRPRLAPALLALAAALAAGGCAAPSGLRTAAQIEARAASGLAGIYKTTLPAASAAKRAITLELTADGEAVLSSVYVGRGVVAERGRWSVGPGGTLHVDWSAGASGVAPASTSWTRAASQLVTQHWDPAIWGEAGLPLERWEPSRAPHPGCHWRPFADAALAIRLLVQECPESPVALVVREGALLLVAADSSPDEGTAVLEIFEKPVGKPIDAAIRERFVPQLRLRARRDCTVVRSSRVDLGDPTREAWELAPTARYRAATTHWRATEPAAMVCGPYGEREEVGYFAYHSQESEGRYLFVRLGLGVPVFDERAIELLD